jgi:hypothetical protein
MSLKGFHIVFIIFSTLLALGIGAWCVWVDLVEGAPIYLAGAICSLVVAVALVVYGVWFYRKMKRLRIITWAESAHSVFIFGGMGACRPSLIKR